MSADLRSIIQSKEAERRRLRALPWLEKLEMLDKLRQRHIWLQTMRPVTKKQSGRNGNGGVFKE